MRTSSALFIMAFTMITSLAHAIDLPIDGAEQVQSNKSAQVTARHLGASTEGFIEISADEAKVIDQVLSAQYTMDNPAKVHCTRSDGAPYDSSLAFVASSLSSDAINTITVFRRLGAHPALKAIVKSADETDKRVYLFDEKGKNIIGLDAEVIKIVHLPESQENVGTDLVPKLVTIPAHDKELPVSTYECDVIK